MAPLYWRQVVRYDSVSELPTFLCLNPQEFDLIMDGMDPKEMLAYQKKQLKKRLGLEEFMDMNDMINDEDIVTAAEERQKKK